MYRIIIEIHLEFQIFCLNETRTRLELELFKFGIQIFLTLIFGIGGSFQNYLYFLEET